MPIELLLLFLAALIVFGLMQSIRLFLAKIYISGLRDGRRSERFY